MTSLNYGYISEDIDQYICPDPNITTLQYNELQSFETTPNNIVTEIKIIHNSIRSLLNSTDIDIIDTYMSKINNEKQLYTGISDDLNEKIECIKTNEGNNEKQTDISQLNEKNELEIFDESIEKFKINYKNIQDKFLKVQDKFKKEIEMNNEDIHITKELLNHAKIVNNKYKNNDVDELLENIKNLSNTILNNSKIKEIKREYLDTKNELDSFLKIIKKINGFNLGSLCICCITNPVNMCFNPCGHTICEECLQSLKGNNYEFECLVCRKKVNDVIKIYYT